MKNDHVFYNIDLAYNEIHPPKKFESQNCDISLFSESEKRFISIFASSVYSHQYHYQSVPSEYLHARDIFSVIFRLSKNIRNYFMQNFLYPSPGLFKTDFGEENECKLYNHQLISLQKMTTMENRDNRFGILRGGILADEPGLGKTVTVLALCLSTAGMMPKSPDCFWDETSLAEAWNGHAVSGSLTGELLPAINNLMKIVGKSPALIEIQRQISTKDIVCSGFQQFERQGRLSDILSLVDRIIISMHC
jgi:hypothetical protein